MKLISINGAAFVLISALACFVFWLATETQEGEAFGQEPVDGPAPVEKDMHEFMEYIFQPTYQRLKEQMATAPRDNQSWKAIKSDSLILAEGGNLLLARLPKEKPEDWAKLSVQVRDLGGQLYQAAKKKDFKSARQQYEAMLVKCNLCHQQFVDGEHQLTP